MMLNNRQREFRKMMKEVENNKNNPFDIYSYRDKRFVNEKPRKRKKKLLQISGGLGIILLIWNLFALSTYFMPGEKMGLVSNDQLEVHHYIEKNSQVEMELNQSIALLVSLHNENNLNVKRIEEIQLKLLELPKKLETTDQRFIALQAYTGERFSLAYQATNVLKLGASEATTKEFTYIIQQQNKLLERRGVVLARLLTNEDMHFEKLEDGSITYEYGL